MVLVPVVASPSWMAVGRVTWAPVASDEVGDEGDIAAGAGVSAGAGAGGDLLEEDVGESVGFTQIASSN